MVIFRYALAILVAGILVAGCDTKPGANPPGPKAIHQGGRIYTPVGQDERGCMRYSVEIPGGVAPAALYHRLQSGKFIVAHDKTDCAFEAGGLLRQSPDLPDP